MKKEDRYYEAMLARDHRFDGKFFIGVKTTGIYCRPICPAKPKRENVLFFSNYLDAEKAGFRPCMRCRPESAPLSPLWVGKSAVVQRAIKVIHSQETIKFDEDKFAELFGVTARHLRRLFTEEIGKTPKQLAFENRLNLARKLITETSLSMTEVAFASGFSSIRRFNDAFKKRFKKNPTEIRRHKQDSNSPLVIGLSYRPPFNYEALFATYQSHQVGELEHFEDGKMTRVVSFGKKVGKIIISNDKENSKLLVEIDFPDTSMIHAIITRVRTMFDLDSDPVTVANTLEKDPKIKKILKQHPGIRIPSGWDPFEKSIAVILGQLVSIEQGRALTAQLIKLAGKNNLFPTPQDILKADLTELKTTNKRKQTLRDFSQALINEDISLTPTQDVELFAKNVMKIKGIGKWTADYMALKVLRHADSFPATDLILSRTLEHHPEDVINQMSPWRGYLAALFWREYSVSLTRKKIK